MYAQPMQTIVWESCKWISESNATHVEKTKIIVWESCKWISESNSFCLMRWIRHVWESCKWISESNIQEHLCIDNAFESLVSE